MNLGGRGKGLHWLCIEGQPLLCSAGLVARPSLSWPSLTQFNFIFQQACKDIYSEKATKFCEIFPLLLTTVQVNLCQKLLFLHQLTHNITTDCSLNYNSIHENSKLKSGGTCCVEKLFLTFRTIFVHNMFSPCSAKRRASDKDLPVLWLSRIY